MVKRNPSLQEIKQAIRDKYAWPGGYPLYLVCADGEALSIDAGREDWRQIVRAHLWDDMHDQWRIIGVEINYEDPALYCAHSGKRIKSAYAEDETE